MVVEADVAVVVGRGRGGQQDEVAARAELILCLGDEFDACLLYTSLVRPPGLPVPRLH